MAKAPTKPLASPAIPPVPHFQSTKAAKPAAVVEAAPVEVSEATEASPPSQTAGIIQASTRYGFPVYVPTQKKLIAPAEVVPLILDSWVKNQLEQERGALVRAKL